MQIIDTNFTIGQTLTHDGLSYLIGGSSHTGNKTVIYTHGGKNLYEGRGVYYDFWMYCNSAGTYCKVDTDKLLHIYKNKVEGIKQISAPTRNQRIPSGDISTNYIVWCSNNDQNRRFKCFFPEKKELNAAKHNDFVIFNRYTKELKILQNPLGKTHTIFNTCIALDEMTFACLFHGKLIMVDLLE